MVGIHWQGQFIEMVPWNGHVQVGSMAHCGCDRVMQPMAFPACSCGQGKRRCEAYGALAHLLYARYSFCTAWCIQSAVVLSGSGCDEST
jgi:hypothetical protein